MDSWYTKNRDRVLTSKRERYQTDAVHRAKKQIAALARYYKLKGADPPIPKTDCFLH